MTLALDVVVSVLVSVGVDEKRTSGLRARALGGAYRPRICSRASRKCDAPLAPASAVVGHD